MRLLLRINRWSKQINGHYVPSAISKVTVRVPSSRRQRNVHMFIDFHAKYCFITNSFKLAPFFHLSAPLFRQATPKTVSLKIATDCSVPKLGLMLVGWGGNNGSTITAAFEANRQRLEWRTKDGTQSANWYGSITQASTVLLGSDAEGKDIYAPMNSFLPMVNPDDIGKLRHCSGLCRNNPSSVS